MRRQSKHFFNSSTLLDPQIYTDDLVAATGFGRKEGESIEGWGTVASNPYLIENAAQFKYFVEEINRDSKSLLSYKGAYFRLTTDICIATSVWTPIGISSSSSFRGFLDGGKHTISGELKGGSRAFGLFGFVRGGVITNLHISATLLQTSTSLFTGIVAGYGDNIFVEDCVVSGSIKGESCSQAVGGLLGVLFGATSMVRGSLFSGVIDLIYVGSNTYLYAGGIVGNFTSGTLTGCSMSGRLSMMASLKSLYLYAGGIAGVASSSVTRCVNGGSVFAKGSIANIGGVVGAVNLTTVALLYCVNRGELRGSSPSVNRIGGLVGENFGTIHASHNYGRIAVNDKVKSTVGGLIGHNTASGQIYTCCNDHALEQYSCVGSGVLDMRLCTNKEHKEFLV